MTLELILNYLVPFHLACFEMKTSYNGFSIGTLKEKVNNAKDCMLRCQFTSRYVHEISICRMERELFDWEKFTFMTTNYRVRQ